MFTTGETVEPVEWITDDTCLVIVVFVEGSHVLNTKPIYEQFSCKLIDTDFL